MNRNFNTTLNVGSEIEIMQIHERTWRMNEEDLKIFSISIEANA
jgi:hypothetical protein